MDRWTSVLNVPVRTKSWPLTFIFLPLQCQLDVAECVPRVFATTVVIKRAWVTSYKAPIAQAEPQHCTTSDILTGESPVTRTLPRLFSQPTIITIIKI